MELYYGKKIVKTNLITLKIYQLMIGGVPQEQILLLLISMEIQMHFVENYQDNILESISHQKEFL